MTQRNTTAWDMALHLKAVNAGCHLSHLRYVLHAATIYFSFLESHFVESVYQVPTHITTTLMQHVLGRMSLQWNSKHQG
jgi:hypothetical protein